MIFDYAGRVGVARILRKYMYERINLAFEFTKHLCNKKKYSKDYVIREGVFANNDT
jgi:hypothetical protein